MCLLKSNVHKDQVVDGIECSLLEMDDCNVTNDTHNDRSTSSEQDCSVIVVDD